MTSPPASAVAPAATLPTELFHFPLSHFNEKARWALDRKQVPHVRHALLPGPHRLKMNRLSGQGQVPVLRCCGRVVAGSAAIIDHLEKEHPGPSLYPASPVERERALELQRWLDAEVGPAVRRARFAEMMADPGYFASHFTFDRGVLTRAAYRAFFPAVQLLMRRDLDLSRAAVERALETTERALDFVAAGGGDSDYLVGDVFTVADLAAASLLFPCVEPPGTVESPKPRAPVLEHWLARWVDHPGAEWVRMIYRRHRGPSSAAG